MHDLDLSRRLRQADEASRMGGDPKAQHVGKALMVRNCRVQIYRSNWWWPF